MSDLPSMIFGMELLIDVDSHMYVLVYRVGAVRLRKEGATVPEVLRKMAEAIERADEA